MRNYNQWEDMIGTNGRYKIRLAEDNRTVEVMNARGKILRGTIDKAGYCMYNVSYGKNEAKHIMAHQLSYKQWGDNDYWPNGHALVIDHIDSNKANSHPSNLRLVTHRENCSKERTKKSGLPVGVVFLKKRRRYLAQITFGTVNKRLGCFSTMGAASLAYQKALKELAHV